MKSLNEKKLEVFEPENDMRHWTRHIKYFILALIFLFIILKIVFDSLDQIGTLKSQSSDFSNPSQLEFKLTDIDNLLEMKFFVNMSTESVEKAMDCHVNQN